MVDTHPRDARLEVELVNTSTSLRVMAEESAAERPFTAAILRAAAGELEELEQLRELVDEAGPVVQAARRAIGTLSRYDGSSRHPLYMVTFAELPALRDRLEELEPLLLYRKRASS